MLLGGDAVHGPAVAPGLPGAPLECLGVQVGGVAELAPGREVALDIGDQPLDLALRERMVRLAESRLEPDARHEGRVVHLPDRLALDVAPRRDAAHVVRQDVFRHAHDHEGVDHAYEEVLLPGVREELDVARSAMMAHHREARYLEVAAVPALDPHEAPVHLVALAGLRLESPSAAALRVSLGELALGGNQVRVRGDVVLDSSLSALVALARDALEDDLGVRYALHQQGVHHPLEATDDR